MCNDHDLSMDLSNLSNDVSNQLRNDLSNQLHNANARVAIVCLESLKELFIFQLQGSCQLIKIN